MAIEDKKDLVIAPVGITKDEHETHWRTEIAIGEELEENCCSGEWV